MNKRGTFFRPGLGRKRAFNLGYLAGKYVLEVKTPPSTETAPSIDVSKIPTSLGEVVQVAEK